MPTPQREQLRRILWAALVACSISGCDRVVDVAEDPEDEAIASPLGGVEPIDCPSKKPWSATIVTTDAGFSPTLVRVAQGHIIMFARSKGSTEEMVADDGSFDTDELRNPEAPETPVCLRFTRVGSYPYHSDERPDAVRGVVEIH
jgi:hypothetical protein